MVILFWLVVVAGTVGIAWAHFWSTLEDRNYRTLNEKDEVPSGKTSFLLALIWPLVAGYELTELGRKVVDGLFDTVSFLPEFVEYLKKEMNK